MSLVGLMLLYAAPFSATSETIPSRFVADRVYVVPQTEDGKVLTLFSDSGGGFFLTEQAAQRLHLPMTSEETKAEQSKDEPPRQLATMPRFKPGFGIPVPPNSDGKIPVMPTELVTKNRFDEDSDGMLGQAWFGGRIWTWDYPSKRLAIESSGWKAPPRAARVTLGFPIQNSGERGDNFPRITIRVDGKPIDMLLDTGATTTLTPETLATVADGLPATRATSMIVDTQFQAWRKAHPDWRVIEKAQAGSNAAMIEVPVVEIAGSRVGPVWFTWRPDKNFHKFMSSMMDKQVESAIGGNALAHFVMTIDYPGAAAYFQCALDCKPIPRSVLKNSSR